MVSLSYLSNALLDTFVDVLLMRLRIHAKVAIYRLPLNIELYCYLLQKAKVITMKWHLPYKNCLISQCKRWRQRIAINIGI